MVAKGRVLVIDDDRLLRGILAEALADDGYDVETAENGLRALDVLNRWAPDLILLDLMMPVMDGPSFRARQLSLDGLSEVPVLILSAARDAPEQSERLGAQGCIAKPFDLGVVLDTIARLIHHA